MLKMLLKIAIIRSRIRILVLTSLCILVSACCSPGIKPEDANLFQASCGIASGEFEKQLESDKAQLASSQQNLEEEELTTQTLETDLESMKAERARLLIKLDKMEHENRQLEVKIGKMRADSENEKDQQANSRAELIKIQGELEALKQKAAVEQETLQQYHSEAARLQQEIEVLRMIISAQ